MTFASKLRQVCEIYTAHQSGRVFKTTFAKAMGVPIGTLNDWLTGRVVPPPDRQLIFIIMATRPDLSEQIEIVAKEWGIKK
jgi:DNA-binding transcriptional regulator YiaG